MEEGSSPHHTQMKHFTPKRDDMNTANNYFFDISATDISKSTVIEYPTCRKLRDYSE
jgi:hypothetical protein